MNSTQKFFEMNISHFEKQLNKADKLDFKQIEYLKSVISDLKKNYRNFIKGTPRKLRRMILTNKLTVVKDVA